MLTSRFYGYYLSVSDLIKLITWEIYLEGKIGEVGRVYELDPGSGQNV